MQDLNWREFTERPDVVAELSRLTPAIDALDVVARQHLVRDHAPTVFETWPSAGACMAGSLKVVTFADYYIVMDRHGDCHGPVRTFDEVIAAGALPTGDREPSVECDLNEADTFAMAAEMVGLGGKILINDEAFIVNEECLSPDMTASLGEVRDGATCVGIGDLCDTWTWYEAAEWLEEATRQFQTLQDGVENLGGDLGEVYDGPTDVRELFEDTLGLELHRYFYDHGPGRSGYHNYAWAGETEASRALEPWRRHYLQAVQHLRAKLPAAAAARAASLGDGQLDELFELLQEHDVQL